MGSGKIESVKVKFVNSSWCKLVKVKTKNKRGRKSVEKSARKIPQRHLHQKVYVFCFNGRDEEAVQCP